MEGIIVVLRKFEPFINVALWSGRKESCRY